jgi:hypothetical protein
MKKFLTLLAALSGALLVAAVPVQAAGTSTVFHVRNGQDAFAVYTTMNGSIETDAFIVGQSGKVQTPPGSPQLQKLAVLELATVDLSTGPPTPIAVGTGQVVPTMLVFGSDLNSATLVATIPMTDVFTGQPLGNAEVNLSWTGIGPVTTQNNITHVRMAGFSVTSHFIGSTRDAAVTGSILFGGVDYAIGLNQAGIDNVKISETDIQH